jgi:molybdopterin synthase sulfur carrier subunit
MRLTVLYFARLREAVGTDREVVDAPDGLSTLGELRGWLAARGEPWSSAFEQVRPIRMAQDHVLGDSATPIRAGAQVAFFPPVTGG